MLLFPSDVTSRYERSVQNKNSTYMIYSSIGIYTYGKLLLVLENWRIY